MSKQPASFADTKTGSLTIWHFFSRRGFSFLSTFLLVVLIWIFLQGAGTFGAWGVIPLVLLTAALSLAVERSLVSLQLSIGRRYRLALLGSIGIVSGLWLAMWLITGTGLSPWWLVLVIIAAFLGCILATQLNEGLWENNSPPSAEVTEAVYQQHQALIGQPFKVPRLKRAFDVLLSFFGLLFSLPLWFISIFIIWLEDPGPLLFVKNSVGRGGMNFHQFKLRTMVRGAEDSTGPVLASEKDDRVLGMGYLLRKTALDELPQLFNILKGEMSFVGPRPQRTVLVQGYLRDLPGYAQRHQVLPGLAGLAQVAGDYYLTPLQKLRFDRLYIRYTSLGFDLKLIFLAFMITFWYRWQKEWDGRLPRKLLRMGSSTREYH